MKLGATVTVQIDGTAYQGVIVGISLNAIIVEYAVEGERRFWEGRLFITK